METTTTPTPEANETSLRERNELVAHIQSSEIFRDYQRAFQALTGLPLVLRAAGAFQSGLSGVKGGNAFCALIAARNKTCAACLNMQQRLESSSCAGAGTSACFAGLHESAVPVRLGDQVVAYLQTGQVLFNPATTAEARKAARQAAEIDAGADQAQLEAAYRESRVIRRHQYDSILQLLQIFAQQLSSLSNQLMVRQAQTEAPAISRARAFIAEHLGEDLTLHQVSRAVGMSSFYFCKNFKKGTGLTFTNYLSRMRVEAVKQLLLDPYKRVSEAAYEAGFQSLSQFNRMFHRITGESPSAYRDRVHSSLDRAPTRARLAAA
ncbi:MAG TPA: helix-turn-helix domain-containing protein [Lacunisphaera sp.]|nr:helix-turn-helix domain-containing protein [Lacunisphaera sp.]